MAKDKIAVIGSSSMVGSRFCQLTRDFNLAKADLHSSVSCDITATSSVEDFFKNYKFSQVILFSAFTDVDEAEKQREDKNGSCWQINVEGTENIVQACQKYGRKLIFISTDFVFDGTKGPYNENDLTGSNLARVSWYGITKIEAEKTITNRLDNYIILRIAYPYRSKFAGKDDIAKRILRLYQKGQLYPMFADQTITPTLIDDLTPAVKLLITTDQKGIFHLASPTLTTQYEFAKILIAKFGGNPADVKKGSLAKFLKEPGRTPRPLNGGLKVDKIVKLGFMPTSWQEGIEIIYQQSRGKLI